VTGRERLWRGVKRSVTLESVTRLGGIALAVVGVLAAFAGARLLSSGPKLGLSVSCPSVVDLGGVQAAYRTAHKQLSPALASAIKTASAFSSLPSGLTQVVSFLPLKTVTPPPSMDAQCSIGSTAAELLAQWKGTSSAKSVSLFALFGAAKGMSRANIEFAARAVEKSSRVVARIAVTNYGGASASDVRVYYPPVFKPPRNAPAPVPFSLPSGGSRSIGLDFVGPASLSAATFAVSSADKRVLNLGVLTALFVLLFGVLGIGVFLVEAWRAGEPGDPPLPH
jgi:hypothetical protein